MTDHPTTPTNTTSGTDAPPPPPNTVPDGQGRTGMDQLAHTLTEPLAVIARALPTGPVPVVLGAGALAVAGIVDWPIVAAIGLGYLAVRRWR